MKLGIYGGTFDPVHYGHLVLVDTCLQELNLDEVRLLPAGQPPHKTPDGMTDGHTRADMLQLAVSGCPDLIVDRREIRRQGKSFTVDTLREFRSERPEDELYFLMGADSVRDLPTWKDPDEIVKLANVVGVNRPGVEQLTPQQVRDWVGDDLAGSIRLLQMPGCDLSSSDLRQRVAQDRRLRFLTPRAVEAFIQECRLYR